MKALWRVLLRTLAARFYLEHAGWLAAGLFFGGGILSGTEHKALILAALADGRVLAAAYLLPWTLYTLVSIRYALRAWATEANEVLRVLRLVPPTRRWLVGLGVQATILAPCWLYGAGMAVFAIQQRRWGPLAILNGWLAFLTVLGWAAHEWALRGPHPTLPHWVARLSPRLRPLPPALWWLRERVRTRPWSLLALKAVSLFTIWGLCYVYSPTAYDARLLTLGGLLTVVIHGLLPGELYAFERTRLSLLWNLPLGPVRRFAGHALLFGVLLLPELAAWLRWCPAAAGSRWLWATRLWAFPVGALLLTWASLLWRAIAPEKLLGRVLPIAFATYLLLMARLPLEVLTLGGMLTAAALTQRFFWQADDVPTSVETSR